MAYHSQPHLNQHAAGDHIRQQQNLSSKLFENNLENQEQCSSFQNNVIEDERQNEGLTINRELPFHLDSLENSVTNIETGE